ncbi:MAG: phenylalanine--tRNA ligase subunit beta [Oscillatoriales cyanobacterium RM2_1_1]|nr:phenylalanine--tRNA ligase subunit beta [Oscillatoriales cyanobacterium RM2_1_1]
MRISLKWLRELVEFTLTPEQLAETLTVAGFEVEEIEDRTTWAKGVVLGRILEAEKHPDADKLQICQVDIGAESPLNIVCGAANARTGMVVPVATVGAHLPRINLTIKKSKLRGVPSEGMICSLTELGLEKESEGIHGFNLSDPVLGSDVRPLLGLDDVILDITATANRADGLSMVGIAREVAALTGGRLNIPEAAGVMMPTGNTTSKLEISLPEPQICPIYIGTVIEGVTIAPAPDWLQQRLQSAGVRPINNVVDVTNYILLEWGQPLHGFDRDRLQQVAGSPDLTLGVRLAREGESLKTLDGQSRTLEPETLLITANDHAVALAGVMGGEATEVHGGTENLMLEAAIFNPVSIRRSARSQGIRTEASTRYERGVNIVELPLACRRAIQLMTELAEGTVVVQASSSSLASQPTVADVPLRLERIHQILGTLKRGEDTLVEAFLQADEVENILAALGCGLIRQDQGGQVSWRVTVPPYRARDLEREIDLIEEVARLYGYDGFGDTLPSKNLPGELPPEQQAIRQLRAAFRAQGLTELMHYSLVKTTGDQQVTLANPLFVEYSALRTEMVSGLIDAFVYNLENGNGALNGFEIGRIFAKADDQFTEQEKIAGIIGGDSTQGRWIRGGQEQPITWYEAKGILEAVFHQFNLQVDYKPDPSVAQLHPGRTASLWLGDAHLGVFGQLHPRLRQQRELPDAVYGFVLDLPLLVAAIARTENRVRQFQGFSLLPPSDRDIAFFVPLDVPVAAILQSMEDAGGKLLESIELFDDYRGQGVPEGERSLAFRLVYRAGDRTLTEADIDPLQKKVRESLVEQFNARLRS